jgi:hypothetical protein
MKRRKGTAPQARRHWNATELAWLVSWAKRGKTAKEIGAKLGRSAKGVQCKARDLGIALYSAGTPPTYSEKTVKAALRRYLGGEKQREIAADLGCSTSMITYWLYVRGADYRMSDLVETR